MHYENGRIDKGYYWQPCFISTGRQDREALKQHHGGRYTACSRPQYRRALKGGLHRTVCGMLSKLCASPARSFSIGFHERGYDEMEYARAAARAFGDLVVVLQSGAYGLSANPAHFLSHPPPLEVLV